MDYYLDTEYLSIPTFYIIQMIIIMISGADPEPVKTCCKQNLHTIELEHITLAF